MAEDIKGLELGLLNKHNKEQERLKAQIKALTDTIQRQSIEREELMKQQGKEKEKLFNEMENLRALLEKEQQAHANSKHELTNQANEKLKVKDENEAGMRKEQNDKKLLEKTLNDNNEKLYNLENGIKNELQTIKDWMQTQNTEMNQSFDNRLKELKNAINSHQNDLNDIKKHTQVFLFVFVLFCFVV